MGKIPMKRRLLILMSLFVLGSSIGFAQKVTLNYNRTNLRTVLERVTEQTDYTLAFSKEVVDLNDEVTIRVNETDLATVLNQLLTPRNIGYEIRDNKIYIFDKAISGVAEATQSTQLDQRLTGRVTDDNGEPVIGANISIPGTSIGTVTDYDATTPSPFREDPHSVSPISAISIVSIPSPARHSSMCSSTKMQRCWMN